MRSSFAALLLTSLIGIGTATGAECPAGALGTSRTIALDPREHMRVGGHQYRETLPLADKEVVLTFDDGPVPPYTLRILDALAAECVKATFFMVGRMVRDHPATVRRIYNEGHTVANHSQNHPFTFHRMTVDEAAREIEDGFASLRAVLGARAVAPFFRIPGLLRQDSVESYLASQGYMTWSVDALADDWTRISADEVARRAVDRIEAHRRGILLLHDIQPATALALPAILRELKERGFKIVHVVPATADRPKTVTDPQLWAVRHAAPRPQVWPRVLTLDVEPAEPVLAAPSPANFGVAESRGRRVQVALMGSFEIAPTREGDLMPAPAAPWPRGVHYSAPEAADILPVPAESNFRYSRAFRLPKADRTRVATRKPANGSDSATARAASQGLYDPRDAGHTGNIIGRSNGLRPPRPVGHQFSVMRPLRLFPLPFGLRY